MCLDSLDAVKVLVEGGATSSARLGTLPQPPGPLAGHASAGPADPHPGAPIPHATQAYGFEAKLFGLASRLAGHHRPGAGASRHAWLFLPGPHGELEVLTPSHSEVHGLCERLRHEGRAYLFWDPFDFPEYAWLEWHKLDRTTAETLLGGPFEESDFINTRDRSHRDWPPSWNVMF